MTLKDTTKKIIKKIKSIFIKADLFREHCEDELAKVLNDMSSYTKLDDVKEKLIQTGIFIALSYAPVVGGVAVALTSEQVATLSKEIVKAGHKAEKLLAIQLAKQ